MPPEKLYEDPQCRDFRCPGIPLYNPCHPFSGGPLNLKPLNPETLKKGLFQGLGWDFLQASSDPTLSRPFTGTLTQSEACGKSFYSDPQKDLKIRSSRTIGGIMKGLYRGYNGSIKGI